MRFVGVTGLPLASLRTLLSTAPRGSIDTLLSYCHYTLLDDTLLSLLPAASSAGVGVMNASPLAMGLLSPGGPPDWHPAGAAMKAAAKAAAAELPLLPRVAIAFSVRHEGMATTFVGMCTRDQVRDNVDTVRAALAGPPTAEEAEQMRRAVEIFEPVHNTTWPSGKPENN